MGESAPAGVVLALNSGSSSLKFGLYRVHGADVEPLLSGEAESIGRGEGAFHVTDRQGRELIKEAAHFSGQEEAVARVARALTEAGTPAPDAVGHRLVHGGPEQRRHARIDEAVMTRLEAAAALAPVHMPAALAVLRFARAHFPDRPMAACLDTAFHADMPEVARVLPLPRALRAEGIERYGFHGLSCESILRQLGGGRPSRLVIAHLGSGASVTAVRDGRSIDNTMGLTPAGGIVMATRAGDLDPGVLVWLMRARNLGADAIEDLVNHRSGLLGISGVDGDLRRLRAAAASSAESRLAIEMFRYSARRGIAAMIAALEGIDLLVLTGGIGENEAATRDAICSGLSWAGVGSVSCPIRVLPAREAEEIARHTWELCREG